jgi:hypothetical protein
MSMKSKILEYKKSKIILNLKKYSNVALFSRKEEEFEKNNNTFNKSSKTHLYNKRYKRIGAFGLYRFLRSPILF